MLSVDLNTMTKTKSVNWKKLLDNAWDSYRKKKKNNSGVESTSSFEPIAKTYKKKIGSNKTTS